MLSCMGRASLYEGFIAFQRTVFGGVASEVYGSLGCGIALPQNLLLKTYKKGKTRGRGKGRAGRPGYSSEPNPKEDQA
jgi:hypothetical protein